MKTKFSVGFSKELADNELLDKLTGEFGDIINELDLHLLN